MLSLLVGLVLAVILLAALWLVILPFLFPIFSLSAEAARIAQLAEAKQLILGHFSKRYRDESPLLNEAKEIFPNTILANDGMRIDLL